MNTTKDSLCMYTLSPCFYIVNTGVMNYVAIFSFLHNLKYVEKEGTIIFISHKLNKLRVANSHDIPHKRHNHFKPRRTQTVNPIRSIDKEIRTHTV